jgi:hypothetical protein
MNLLYAVLILLLLVFFFMNRLSEKFQVSAVQYSNPYVAPVYYTTKGENIPNTWANFQMKTENTNQGNGVNFLADGGRNSHWGWSSTQDWYLRSGKSNGSVIIQDNGGNVGIGTSQPQSTLDVNGNTNINRNLSVKGNLNIFNNNRQNPSKLVIGGPIEFVDENGTDSSDPYRLQKISNGINNNHLRLTINDDANESLQIWGNSCLTTGCGGSGVVQHTFDAVGKATHKQLCLVDQNGNNPVCLNYNTLRSLTGTAPITIRASGGNRLQASDGGAGPTAQFANRNRGVWEQMYLESF